MMYPTFTHDETFVPAASEEYGGVYHTNFVYGILVAASQTTPPDFPLFQPWVLSSGTLSSTTRYVFRTPCTSRSGAGNVGYSAFVMFLGRTFTHGRICLFLMSKVAV